LARTSIGDRAGSEGKLKGGVVDTRHVASAAWLVFFGLEAEGVHVDTGGGAVGVVLVGLNQVEVATFASGESVVAVKLDLGISNGVVAAVKEEVAGGETNVPGGSKGSVGNGSNIGTSGEIGVGLQRVRSRAETSREAIGLVNNLNTANGSIKVLGHRTGTANERAGADETFTQRRARSSSQGGVVQSIGVVEPLRATNGFSGIDVNVGVGLDNPDKFLNGVVEVEFDLVGSGVDGFGAGELELFDEVFVRSLGKASAFIGVQVDVVDVQRGGLEGGNGEGGVGDIVEPVAAGSVAEFKVDLNFVVLKSNQGKSKTGVAAEPEFKRDVESGFGHAATKIAIAKSHGRSSRNTGHKSGVVTGSTRSAVGSGTGDGLGETGNVANHGGITSGVASGLGEFVPDVEPVTVLTIDALTTDFNINLSNHDVAEPV